MLTILCIVSIASTPALTGTELFVAGNAAQRSGAYETAAHLFLDCAGTSELLRPYALSRAGETLSQTGDFAKAAQLLEQVLRDHPDGPWVRLTHARLGYLYLNAKQPDKACEYFRRVLAGLDPRPWFLNALALTHARTMLTLPAHAGEGYAFFRDIVQTTIYSRDRIEAARLLLNSPSEEDRLWGVYGLVRGGNLKEGRTALEKEAVVFQGAANTPVALPELDALLGPAPHAPGSIPRLEACVRENRESVAMRVWLMLALREQAMQDHPATAEALTSLLIRYFNEGRDAGDACWWLAERYERKADTPSADRVYRRLVESCPDHVRAPRSQHYLADHAREKGDLSEALALYKSLADGDPQGQFAAESYYRCAQIADTRTIGARAQEYLALAAGTGPGDFYAHRALHLLRQRQGASPDTTRQLRVLPGDSFIQAFPFQEAHKLNLMPLIEHFPTYPRLRFFGENGFEEGEWESLHCILTTPASLEKLWYPAIAEAGYMHTLIQFVTARGWGLKDGKPTLLRQRLLYPLAYWKTMKSTGASLGVDPYFLLATARQESTFRASIGSSAGATGVLQLMPDTARWLARVDDRVTADHASNLNSPRASILMGGVYMSRMLERSSNNAIYALASYNAGPGNCDKWRKRFSTVSMEAFMEAIPFSETNGYVKKVLANYATYHSLYPPPERAIPYAGE